MWNSHCLCIPAKGTVPFCRQRVLSVFERGAVCKAWRVGQRASLKPNALKPGGRLVYAY